MRTEFDYIIIGAGIVGLATAYWLRETYTRASILVVDKEDRVAKHQSSHNSGVIHSGIFYKANTLKAKLCLSRRSFIIKYCQTNKVPLKLISKLVVATSNDEIDSLSVLGQQAEQNGIDYSVLNSDQIKNYEPSISGLKALLVRNVFITDYSKLSQTLYQELKLKDVKFQFNCLVKSFSSSNSTPGAKVYLTDGGCLESRLVINCAGLYSDLIRADSAKSITIVPFRGEYYNLSERASKLINGLVYGVPTKGMPFLGIHFSKSLNDSVKIGPSAVLAFSRQGYRLSDINFNELSKAFNSIHFQNFAKKNISFLTYELYRSIFKFEYYRSAKKLLPKLAYLDLLTKHSGVRAQALLIDGTLCNDFEIVKSASIIDVLNTPSPAASACFGIGEYIANLTLDKNISFCGFR